MFDGLGWREKRQRLDREEEGSNEHLVLFWNKMMGRAVLNFFGSVPEDMLWERKWKGLLFGELELLRGLRLWWEATLGVKRAVLVAETVRRHKKGSGISSNDAADCERMSGCAVLGKG